MMDEHTEKMLTIHDVASQLGVSASTVSRAISGKGRIGEATRKRIQDYVREQGFYPNAAARCLARAKSNNIAILLPQGKTPEDRSFLHTCLCGVEEVANAAGYDVIVVITKEKDSQSLERLVYNRKVDGVILIENDKKDSLNGFLKEHRVPFVEMQSIQSKEGDLDAMECGRRVCQSLLH